MGQGRPRSHDARFDNDRFRTVVGEAARDARLREEALTGTRDRNRFGSKLGLTVFGRRSMEGVCTR